MEQRDHKTEADQRAACLISQPRRHAPHRFAIHYQSQRFARVKEYLREQSAASAFADISLAKRLAELRLQRKRYGRLRFKQLIGISDLHAIVILATEDGDAYLLAQITVEAEYPHLLTHWQLNGLADVNIPHTETTD